MITLDDKDRKILELLRKNSRLSTQAISKKTIIPITTVHNRLKKLRKTGVIRRWTIEVDEEKLGRPIAAHILVTVEYPKARKPKDFQESIARRLKGYDEVQGVNIIAGKSDIMVFLRASSMKALNDFILEKLRTIEGVDKTETMVVMQEF
ncbi:MAG: Lrp/AsnC family transcriptional regulator [DPANN group archaeon]|nr:Lrp/AsnC family transcriptional regulator [DPANN group archaeon]